MVQAKKVPLAKFILEYKEERVTCIHLPTRLLRGSDGFLQWAGQKMIDSNYHSHYFPL